MPFGNTSWYIAYRYLLLLFIIEFNYLIVTLTINYLLYEIYIRP